MSTEIHTTAQAVKSIIETLETLMMHERVHFITIPIKLKVDYVNVLLHIYKIYPMNVQLRYALHDGYPSIIKEQIADIGEAIILEAEYDLNKFNRVVESISNSQISDWALSNTLASKFK